MAATLNFSKALRSAMLDAIETYACNGGDATLRILDATGLPAACDTTFDSTTLAEFAIVASDWTAASDGTKEMKSMQEGSALASGNAICFRMYEKGGGTVCMQGNVGTSGAALNLDSTSITAGQVVNITSFKLVGGNA